MGKTKRSGDARSRCISLPQVSTVQQIFYHSMIVMKKEKAAYEASATHFWRARVVRRDCVVFPFRLSRRFRVVVAVVALREDRFMLKTLSMRCQSQLPSADGHLSDSVRPWNEFLSEVESATVDVDYWLLRRCYDGKEHQGCEILGMAV